MLPEITGLTLARDTHQYFLRQGSVTLQLPSVTQIIRFISSEFYGQIDYSTLQKAADRGTRVHEAIELIDECDWSPKEEDTAGYIEAYERWKADYQPQIIATEWRGYHRTMLYAGTIDKIIQLPGQTTDGLMIVDLKTSSTYFPFLVDVQLAGYAQMIESWPNMKIDDAWGLQLKPDGSYNFHCVQNLSQAKTYFFMCYALHNAVQREKEA
jgi:hypothetical protein